MVVIEAGHADTGWWYNTRPTLSSGGSGEPGNGSDVRLSDSISRLLEPHIRTYPIQFILWTNAAATQGWTGVIQPACACMVTIKSSPYPQSKAGSADGMTFVLAPDNKPSQTTVMANILDCSVVLQKKIMEKPIIMSETVPSSVYVGFTAATRELSESHQLLDWTFTTFPLPSYSPRKQYLEIWVLMLDNNSVTHGKKS
ncbi:hypothetical protein WN944_000273 [Citrus x changshan-huyou]|uniref:Legume lectin domain-containing protein n=1 Tax=Citrus x changshan-huyou TaxID=2935761 RepID=A0AAP0QLS2_9ROSI